MYHERVCAYVTKVLHSFFYTQTSSNVELHAHTYEVDYILKGVKYVIPLVKSTRGPKQIRSAEAKYIDETRVHNVNSTLRTYMGPNEDFHNSTIVTPRYIFGDFIEYVFVDMWDGTRIKVDRDEIFSLAIRRTQ